MHYEFHFYSVLWSQEFDRLTVTTTEIKVFIYLFVYCDTSGSDGDVHEDGCLLTIMCPAVRY